MPGRNGDHPIAIDPAGCGCTECCTHEYVPIDDPRAQDAFAALADGVIDELHSHNPVSYATWRGTDGEVHVEEFFCPRQSYVVQEIWDLDHAVVLIFRSGWSGLEMIELEHCSDPDDVKFALQTQV